MEEDGIITVPDFIGLQDDYFMDMRHDVVVTDSAGVETTRNQSLLLAKHNGLIWLKCLLIYNMNEGSGDLEVDELKSLEKIDFNRFRCSYSERPKLARTTLTNPNHPILAASSPAAQFQKSIKHETLQYPVLKDICYFDKFEMEFMTLAHTHDIHQVFDSGYIPQTQDEIDLFAEKEKFAMSVLVHSIKTDVGITIVRKHYKNCKAQECWKKIHDEATKSTKADLELMSLQDKLFSTRIDSHWRDDVEGFLLY